MLTWETGMGGLHSSLRNCSRASNAPKVEACTITPRWSVSRLFFNLAMSVCNSKIVIR